MSRKFTSSTWSGLSPVDAEIACEVRGEGHHGRRQREAGEKKGEESILCRRPLKVPELDPNLIAALPEGWRDQPMGGVHYPPSMEVECVVEEKAECVVVEDDEKAEEPDSGDAAGSQLAERRVKEHAFAVSEAKIVKKYSEVPSAKDVTMTTGAQEDGDKTKEQKLHELAHENRSIIARCEQWTRGAMNKPRSTRTSWISSRSSAW